MAEENGKAGKRSHSEKSDMGAGTPNDSALVDSDALLTPRMAAEREVIRSIKIAGETIRRILAASASDCMADAIAIKTQSSLAQWVLESANNIGAAQSGKHAPQLPAAAANSGALALAIAQRLSRRSTAPVQRRIVEAPIQSETSLVQPIAADLNEEKCVAADSVMQPTEADDSDSTAANSGSLDFETP